MSTATRPVSETAQTRYRDHAAVLEKANAGAVDNRAWQDQDEARKQSVPVLHTKKKYVFRSRPGTLRGFSVRIPTLPDAYASDREQERRERDFTRRRLAVDGEKPPFDLDSLRAKVGDEFIVFTQIPGGPDRQGVCFYATDDDEIYAFLMHRRKVDTSGSWANIFIEYPTRLQKINGIEVPGTIAGFEAAQAAFMAEPDIPQE